VFVLSLLLVQPPPPAPPADEGLANTMRPIYVKEAEAYSLAVESAPKTPLGLKKEPVFEWLNPARNTQQGAVFVWLRAGRPAALGCFFSAPRPQYNGRAIMHELHALDPEKVVVTRDAPNKWEPKAGLARKELADAPPPAATSAARQIQIRRLAQEFGGHSIDREKKRWELRLLPTPLYRYPAAKTGVVDGALFALVSNAGTDPEVLLLIEAKEDGGKLKWEYACGRFSDWELHVGRKGAEVWASVPGPDNPFQNDPQHLYRIYPEKIVTLAGETVARLRPGPNGPVVVPLDPKPPPPPGGKK
jgi:hypothetical protein